MDEYNKYLIPVFVVAYGEDPEEAINYVHRALDSTDFVREDGIFSVEVIEDETELYQ